MPPSEINPVEAKDTGVIVLGHGSRAPEAAGVLNRVAAQVEERLPFKVKAASLQFNKPDLEECGRELAGAGARRIIVVPYFLFDGNHIKQDIPIIIGELEKKLPGCEFILTSPLGEDARLVEIVVEKARKAAAGASGPGLKPEAMLTEPEAIAKESFDIIDGLLMPKDVEDPRYRITRRVVHATGDPFLSGRLVFSRDSIEAGLKAIQKQSNIYCDVNMVASGIEPTAKRLGHKVICNIADEETINLARRKGITRGAAGLRRMAEAVESGLEDLIVLIGNAPTALFECLSLARAGAIKPSLIIGVPVGFVGAVESKEALREADLSHITLLGNRGGSSVAAAIMNELLRVSKDINGS